MDPTILKVTAYFNSENTQRFFDQSSVWSVVNCKVYEKLEPDIACNYHHYLPELLDKGLRILVYAGDRDLVCNWVGSLAWMEALRWGGRGGFSRAQPVEYSLLNGTAIGSLKSYSLPITGGQLSFVKVYGAGHSVAMDVPRQALKMLTDFLDNKFP